MLLTPDDDYLAAIDYDLRPSILLFAEDADRRTWLAEAIKGAGGRLSGMVDLSEAERRIDEHAAPAGVVVDLEHADEAVAQVLLGLLQRAAQAHRFASVAIIDEKMIDLAFLEASHRDVQLVCQCDEFSLATAISKLASRRELAFHDVSAEAGVSQLRELSEEIGRIAKTLATLSDRSQSNSRLFGANGETEESLRAIVDPAGIRALIRARRMRDQYFGAELFADPAWDMLLDLMAARLEGRPVAVSSLCIAAAVPPTTALRWIKAMTDIGLLERIADRKDRRRVFIELSPRAVEGMLGYLSAVRRISSLPI